MTCERREHRAAQEPLGEAGVLLDELSEVEEARGEAQGEEDEDEVRAAVHGHRGEEALAAVGGGRRGALASEAPPVLKARRQDGAGGGEFDLTIPERAQRNGGRSNMHWRRTVRELQG